MRKEYWIKQRDAWRRAVMEIATEYDKGSNVYRALGSAAWGRGDHEGDGLESTLLALGFLQGLRVGVMETGDIYEMEGSYALRKIHDRLKKGE